jgi:hypothetical protein
MLVLLMKRYPKVEKGTRSGRFKHPAVIRMLEHLCWTQAKQYSKAGDEFKVIPEASLALVITVVDRAFCFVYL